MNRRSFLKGLAVVVTAPLVVKERVLYQWSTPYFSMEAHRGMAQVLSINSSVKLPPQEAMPGYNMEVVKTMYDKILLERRVMRWR